VYGAVSQANILSASRSMLSVLAWQALTAAVSAAIRISIRLIGRACGSVLRAGSLLLIVRLLVTYGLAAPTAELKPVGGCPP
jgi:hypothetical protein